MSWGTCYSGSNNIYFGFPPIMTDGRNYAQWQPGAVVNKTLREENGIKSNWQYRKYLQENASMQHFLKLSSDKLTDIGTRTFAYNKALFFDTAVPHKNAPISTTPWGTDVTDSPLCFTVFMTTS